MAETLHKGWLKTRDNQLFAPSTLIENVYTRDGKLYDERIRQYIDSQKDQSNTSIAGLGALIEEQNKQIDALKQKDDKIEDKIMYFDNEPEGKTLYIIDKDENVIAYIDETGVNSIDFIIPGDTSLTEVKKSINNTKAEVTSLADNVKNKLKNFNGEDDNTLYIVDAAENVIAYVDNDGIHTTKVNVTEGISNDSDSTLFITDMDENVIAYIDGTGIHSTNYYIDNDKGIIYNLKEIIAEFTSANTNFASALANLQNEINLEKTNRTAEDRKLQSQINNIEKRTKYLNAEENDSFYIIDNNDNVIAYINETGVHSVNFYIDNADSTVYNISEILASLESKDNGFANLITNLGERLSAEEKARNEADANLQDQIDVLDYKTKYLNASNGDGLFIIDQNENTIAYVDDSGLSAYDVFVKEYNNEKDQVIQIASVRDHETRIGNAESGLSDLTNYINDVKKGDTKIPEAEHAETADKWVKEIKLTLDGDASGEISFDGSKDVSLKVSIADDSHNHTNDSVSLNIAVDADDDGIIELAGSAPFENAVKYTAKHKEYLSIPEGSDTATYTKVNIDKYGHIVSGSIPTKLEDYNITDAVTTNEFVSFKNENETAHNTEIELREALSQVINYKGKYDSIPEGSFALGDTAVINKELKIYDGAEWISFDGLSNKLYYLDASADDTIYFIDQLENVIAYINEDGVTSINFNIEYFEEEEDENGNPIAIKVKTNFIEQKQNLDNALNRISNLESEVGGIKSFSEIQLKDNKISATKVNDSFAVMGDNAISCTADENNTQQMNITHKEFYEASYPSENITNPSAISGYGDSKIITISTPGVEEFGHITSMTPQTVTITMPDKQNLFETIKVNNVELKADNANDILTINQGQKIVLTPSADANNDSFTIDHSKDGIAYETANENTLLDGTHGLDKTGSFQIPQFTTNEYGHITAINEETITVKFPAHIDSSVINYLGWFELNKNPSNPVKGSIASFKNAQNSYELKIFNGESWEKFDGLSKKLYNIDGTDDDAIYFTDNENNVVAYINNFGVNATNFIAQELVDDGNGNQSVVNVADLKSIASSVKDISSNLTILNEQKAFSTIETDGGTITANEAEDTITFADDDVIIVKPKANNVDTIEFTHKKVYGGNSGYTTDDENDAAIDISDYGSNSTVHIPTFSVDGYGHVTSANDRELKINIPAQNLFETIQTRSKDNEDRGKITADSATDTVTFKSVDDVVLVSAKDDVVSFGHKDDYATFSFDLEDEDVYLNPAPENYGTVEESQLTLSNHTSINIPYVTSIDKYGHTSAQTQEITLYHYPLTIGDKRYNGSFPVTVEAKDLGLTGALVFLGISTKEITDGGTERPYIDEEYIELTDLTSGAVVLYKKKEEGNSYKEFVWDGNKWELLGDEGSYKVKQTPVVNPTPSDSSTSFISSITQNENGEITVEASHVQFPDYSNTYKPLQEEISKPSTITNKFVSAIGQNKNGVIDVDYCDVDFSTIQDSIDGLSNQLTNLNEFINLQYEDKLYITDVNGNVIAYFDNNGITTTNITLTNENNTFTQNRNTMMFFEQIGDKISVPDSIFI